MARQLVDRKVYEIRLYRNRDLIGNLGKIARELTWTVNRNPQVGYNSLSFKVDQRAFDRWCQSHGIETSDLITPINTDCEIWVRNDPQAEPVCVAWGYLYAYPTLVANTDALDYQFTFKDQFLKLQGADVIPNGTTYTQQYADDVEADLMLKGQQRQNANYGFVRGDTDRLAKIDRTYSDWKPVSEAMAEMCDNSTGAGQFDIWIDQDYRLNIKKPRGQDSGLVFVYPYTTASAQIPMSASPNYEQAPELATAILAVGSGQGDAAVSVLVKDNDAIKKYGYIEQYKQYSSIEQLSTLQQKARADLDAAIYPDPAPTISVNGVFINWANFYVGDRIDYVNNTAVNYGLSGHVRVKTIKVNCDGNRNESITLETEVWNG